MSAEGVASEEITTVHHTLALHAASSGLHARVACKGCMQGLRPEAVSRFCPSTNDDATRRWRKALAVHDTYWWAVLGSNQ